VVPQMLAELLGAPALTYATAVDTDGSKVTIHRQTADGYDVVESSLPAVVTVTAGVVEPRYPTFKGIMDAKKKPMDTVPLGDLGAERSEGQTVKTITDAPERSAGRKIEDEGEAFAEIVALLEERKVI
jgi:electron transfer flavoprotein beta subunit